MHAPLALLGRAAGAGCLAAALTVGLTPSPAGAAPLEQERFVEHEEEVLEDFCGVVGLDVLVVHDATGHFTMNQRGRDQLAYGMATVRGSDSFTNLTTGKTYSSTFNIVDKDLKVTDNGDGTLTILVLATGGGKYYADGEVVLRDPGQSRFELLVDDGGTPGDPSDDELIGDPVLVKGSTGRNDTEGRDFCDDFLTFTA